MGTGFTAILVIPSLLVIPSKNGLADLHPVCQRFGIMRWLRNLMRLLLCGWMGSVLFAAEYKLIDGTALSGELITADKDTFVLKLDGGGYSTRTDWGRLSDESLLAMSRIPKAARFVEPYVTLPSPEDVRRERPTLSITEPQRVPNPRAEKALPGRPERKSARPLTAILTPGGLFFIGAMYLANIFFGFEVARFKWRPPVLVCGVSAVAPIIGPLIFLSMPKWTPPEEISATTEALEATSLSVADSGPSLVQQMGLRTGGSTAAAAEEFPRSFRKGDFTFNRRFIETQFAMFLSSAAPEESAGLVMDVTSTSGHFVANRINRLNASEAILQVVGGEESPVEYSSIQEITLRQA